MHMLVFSMLLMVECNLKVMLQKIDIIMSDGSSSTFSTLCCTRGFLCFIVKWKSSCQKVLVQRCYAKGFLWNQSFIAKSVFKHQSQRRSLIFMKIESFLLNATYNFTQGCHKLYDHIGHDLLNILILSSSIRIQNARYFRNEKDNFVEINFLQFLLIVLLIRLVRQTCPRSYFVEM